VFIYEQKHKHKRHPLSRYPPPFLLSLAIAGPAKTRLAVAVGRGVPCALHFITTPNPTSSFGWGSLGVLQTRNGTELRFLVNSPTDFLFT
jgi:hypothetical protein